MRPLDEVSATGSRLGLSVRDTPATVDVIDADQMLGRGYATMEQAAASLTGVITGGSPGDLADFSMRGFSGQQIVLLRDGLSVGPSNMTNRPSNTFNLERIEILKGPASVLYGQGAVGGAVNIVSKRPRLGDHRIDFMASLGGFGTSGVGLGASTDLGDRVALRADVSRTATDGYVDRASADSLNVTASLLWQITDDVQLTFVIDYLADHPSAYFGTPLVPVSFATQPLRGVIDTSGGVTLDRRMRYVNYNVTDNRIESRQYWPQLQLSWHINDTLTLNSNSYYFNADRTWINSEVYDFNETTRLVDRDRFFVLHDQTLYGNQTSLALAGKLIGLANRLVVGTEYSHLDFNRTRGFPDGESVDPFNPQPALFGVVDSRRQSPTTWNSAALYFEDALDLTGSLKLVTGGRFDRLQLDRMNLFDGVPQASGFERTFNGSNWRLGVVYEAATGVTPYVSFATGQDPVGSSNFFLVNAGQNFDLSDSRQFEAGVKVTSASQRADLTAAVYDIRRNNILTQLNSAGDLSNIGSQRSRGIELVGNAKLLDHWSLSANFSYTEASYGRFFDPDFGIDASGNTPANVPSRIANVWTSVTNVAGTALELGGGIRYVSARYADSGNTLKLQPYTLVDAYAAYPLNRNLRLTARVNNLFDKAYAQWADVFYPTEVLLGAPRRFEVSLVGQF
ncbi:MAG: TonB-dependent receptor [Pseudomonadota bacterium]